MTFQKYLGDSKMFEYDKYYRDCQQQNKPFIKAKINPVHENYFVQIDLATCNYKLSDSDKNKIEQFITSEIDYIKTNSNYEFKGHYITDELSWFDGISLEHLDEFCTFLYDLTQNK